MHSTSLRIPTHSWASQLLTRRGRGCRRRCLPSPIGRCFTPSSAWSCGCVPRFTRISELLERTVPSGNFVTTFYGIIDVAERRMVYANAGHPPPLIVRANGEFERLAVTGAALGFPRAAPMREGYATFARGDGLVLFTDGVTDVGPSPDEFFDVAGIEATVGHLWARDVNQICSGLLDEVVRRAGRVLPDDATAVIVKFD